ncbi:WecB/TagA/CpsF family glycosyltransferase [Sphingomonas oligophenolica]|uniref:WecB/TagA/CpsF family glycosyltransferase n=1 Tax=Sphingomonas oligophenolica TaxID=301154 RepID=A0ABU9YCQ6_9SPHN
MGLRTPECRAEIDGFPIDTDSREAILAAMDEAIKERSPGHYISITNTESIYHGRRLASHGAYIRGADYSLCDGVGVVAAGLAWNARIKRYNGPILQLDCSKYGASRGWRHFYLGGTGGSAEEMARRLTAAYPGMIVCGIYEPPFRPLTADERTALVERIRERKADIVWVGLGLIKQEAMIASLLEEAGVPWMVGVGGAFDYHSGRVPWAPWLVRRVGAEWLFRLIVQPKLRFKRYWWSGVWMITAVGRGILSRFGRKPAPTA